MPRIIPAVLIALALLPSLGCNYRADRARLVGYRAAVDGDHATAFERYSYAIDHDSTDWISHYYLGEIYLHQRNDAVQARRHLELAESIRDTNREARFGNEVGVGAGKVPRPTRAQVTDALAEALFRQGQRNQLISYLRDVTDTHGATADYLRMARYMHKLGDPDAARLTYEKTLKIADPGDPAPLVEFGDFYLAIGDGANALAMYRRAYYLDPEIDGLAEKIRSQGMVPGPTVGVPPSPR